MHRLRAIVLRSAAARLTVAVFALAVLGAAPAADPVCHSCFWQHFEPGLRETLAARYESYTCAGPLCAAEREVLLGRLRDEPARFAAAMPHYRAALAAATEEEQRQLLREALAFAAPLAGEAADPAALLAEAAAAAPSAGMPAWRGDLLRALARGDAAPEFGDAPIGTVALALPARPVAFVLGESEIVVPRGARVGAQVERVARDWIAWELAWDLSRSWFRERAPLGWHEGARLAELVEHAGVEVVPLAGTFLARRGGRWFAPDETGVFRFHVLDDKVQYPLVTSVGPVAYTRDTHGVSAVVEQALRHRVDLVIACGDNPGKVAAAYWLAQRGAAVYTPCDREAGSLLGHDARAPILGTAPIRRLPDGSGAVIGRQPITFRVDEPIVVSDIRGDGVHRYYDAPARYFRALARQLPLAVSYVAVDGPGQLARVVAEAERRGASAIAVRVAYDEDHAVVDRWLAADASRRVVLFHSAAYPAGYRLFFERPAQVTFGDPRPRIVSAGERAAPPAGER